MITRKDITARIGEPHPDDEGEIRVPNGVPSDPIGERAEWWLGEIGSACAKVSWRMEYQHPSHPKCYGASFRADGSRWRMYDLTTPDELDEFLNAVEWPRVDTEDADASPDDDTALIIAALQMEIDRLRDGGKLRLMYWEDGNMCMPEHTHRVREARERCEGAIDDWRDDAQRDSEWAQEVRGVRWGVCVDVERAREFPTSPYCPECEEGTVDYEIAEAWRPDTRVTAHDLCDECNPDPNDERPF